jgi:hypothetical protein
VKCLTVERIYSYLEKELSSSESKSIRQHLAGCLKCRKALEERRILHQTIEGLPSWQVPSGFTQQVMDRIFPAKAPLWGWLAALAGGFVIFILSLGIYVLATGQNLSSIFINFSQTLWLQIKNLSLVFIKFFKLIYIILKIIRELIEHIFSGFLHISTILGPEVQIPITIILILSSSFIVYGIRRKLLFGEKQ